MPRQAFEYIRSRVGELFAAGHSQAVDRTDLLGA
jgi:hypothetical protein